MGVGDRVAADRERDGRRRRRGAVAGRPPRSATRVGHCRRRAAGALHRHLRGVPGRRHADRRGGDPRRSRARRARPGRRRRAAAGGRGARRAPRARRGGRDGVHRPAAGARDPELRAGVRRAGVAAHSRHQHAAQDLLVPAIGQADRGDRPADAHAGADARRSRRWSRPSRRPFAAALARLLDDPRERAAPRRRGASGGRRRQVQPRVVLRRTAQAYARLSSGARRAQRRPRAEFPSARAR